MKTIYEYDIFDKTTGVRVTWAGTRMEARIEKSIYEMTQDSKAKIVQRKYVLAEQREIR